MSRHLAAAPVCEPTFLDFAVPVTIGGLASGAAAFLTRRAMPDVPRRRQDAYAVISSTIAFWLVGGAAWLIHTRRRNRG